MANNTAILTWAANSEPDLAGYKIYYGQFPGIYTGVLTVGLVITTTFQAQFNNDGTWYFGISAFDTSNNESAISSSVNKRIIRTNSYLTRRK